MDQGRDDAITARAHEIWEAEGRPHGRHEQHWEQARQEIMKGANSGAIDADRAADAAPGPRKKGEDLKKRQDQLLDEALEETFPGSDPITPKRIT